jgi:hypothetical protein
MNFLYLFFKIKVKLVEFSFFFIIKKFISFNKIKTKNFDHQPITMPGIKTK